MNRPVRLLPSREPGYEQFVSQRFHGKTVELIYQMSDIIAEYFGHGLILTLRQLYYQLVARAIVENTKQQYKRVGIIVNDARLAGVMNWDAIEDRTRNLITHSSWDSPSSIIRSAAASYREDLWNGQDCYVEVWIEKDALLGVIERPCEEYRVPYFACRGNNSQSEQYKAGKRFAACKAQGLTPIVLHLGDHDPNGLDMTRDNIDRLSMFARQDVEVRRIALNMNQVEQYNPPPNFAKETDTRFDGYLERFGTDECWELDALDPLVIGDLIRTELKQLIDPEAWEAAKAEEEQNREALDLLAKNWTKVEKFLDGLSTE